jgi:hypothetical protein
MASALQYLKTFRSLKKYNHEAASLHRDHEQALNKKMGWIFNLPFLRGNCFKLVKHQQIRLIGLLMHIG